MKYSISTRYIIRCSIQLDSCQTVQIVQTTEQILQVIEVEHEILNFTNQSHALPE